MDLFPSEPNAQPLAARVRPSKLEEYCGQTHLLTPGKPLYTALQKKRLHSMVLWGPPGVGKTTFAMMLTSHCDAHFISISAVMSGVKEIREAVEKARLVRAQTGKDTILFVDEVHRFNKGQQDAFLPYIEDGTIIFVGATTENPSFELNNAILSRARVYVLKRLAEADLNQVLSQACQQDSVLQDINIIWHENAREMLISSASGDARRLLNFLELAVDLAVDSDNVANMTANVIAEVTQTTLRQFDKGGDLFYEQISALHKSVRGSDPDASLYWLMAMLEGGCDPLYVARRLVRIASEDIGNADPRALQLTLNAWDVQERLGSPEGELALAQAVLYLAAAPKSNAVYTAFKHCRSLLTEQPFFDVPEHLRNAPTALMAAQGYGKEYRYAHDEPNAFAAGESYFPEPLDGTRFYYPVARGMEIKIAEKLEKLQQLNRQSPEQRWSRK